jgi:hypothetical protein
MRNRPSREPALDWRRLRQPLICDEYCWTRLGTNVFLGWLRSPGQSASTLVNRLIPMGVWCDSLATGELRKRTRFTHRSPAAQMNLPERRPDDVATRFCLTVDFGRLMGVSRSGATPEVLRAKHAEIHDRIVATKAVDLSATTEPQLLGLALQTSTRPRVHRRGPADSLSGP